MAVALRRCPSSRPMQSHRTPAMRAVSRRVAPPMRMSFSVGRSFSSSSAAPIKVPTTLIAELRKRTEAGVMECKEALSANNLDLDKAAESLIQKGRSAKGKDGRISADGKISIAVAGNHGIILEINTETDFVARNEQFQDLVDRIGGVMLQNKLLPQAGSDTIALDQIMRLKLSDEEGSVENALASMMFKTGEKLVCRRAFGITVPEGIVGGYSHHGRIASLVAVSAKPLPKNTRQLEKFAYNLAVNVVGFPPLFLNKEQVPESFMEERKAAHKDPQNPFKPQKVLEEVVLMEQPMGAEQKPAFKILNSLQKQFEMQVVVERYLRHTLGEGLEKKTVDFAKEVEKQLNKSKV